MSNLEVTDAGAKADGLLFGKSFVKEMGQLEGSGSYVKGFPLPGF